jgi:hypothetical protein
MSFFSARLLAIAALFSFILAGCGGSGSSGTAAAPPNFTATPGYGQVTLNWTADPAVDYWVVYTAGSAITTDNPSGIHTWLRDVRPPYVVDGLSNGTTYAFAVNGRVGNSKGGPSSPSQSATPRPAGATWTAGSGLGSSAMKSLWYGTASSVATFLAVGGSGVSGATASSLDGSSWSTVAAAPSTFVGNGVTYALGQYLAVGAGGSIYRSADLATWTAATSSTTNALNALASNGTTVVTVGDAGTILFSTDGAAWTAATTVPVTTNLYGVVYANGFWIAVGASGTVLTSGDDGVTWTVRTAGTTTTDLRGVAVQYTNAYNYVAVGLGGAVITSPDGVTWTSQTLTGTPDLYAVNASYEQVLAVGAGGTIVSSASGSAPWTSLTSGTNTLNAIYGSSSAYYVVGQNGTVLTSK